MTPEALVARLIEARPPDAALLDEAATMPECLPLLLDQARKSTAQSPEEARRIAHLIIVLAQRQNDGRSEAQAERVVGQASRMQWNHAEAIEAFERAAAAAERAGDRLLTAQVQTGKIDSLGWLERYSEAFALANRLETTLRELGATGDAAKIEANVGTIHFRRDQYAQAHACYEQAYVLFAEAGDTQSRGITQVNLANVLTHQNRVEEALAHYAQAREALSTLGREREVAVIDLNVGHLHQVSGRYSEANAALARARPRFAALSLELEQANCDLALGDIYTAVNLLPEARERYEQALPVYERLEMAYEIAETERGLALTLVAEGQTEQAFAALDRAEVWFQRQRNGVQQANVRLTRASLLHAQGEYQPAAEAALPAQRAFARRKLHGWAAEARFYIAYAAHQQNQDASRSLQAIARAAQQYARGWLAVRAHHALGQHHARRGNRSRALRHYRLATEMLEESRTQIAPEEMHVSYLRDKQAIYESAVAALLERGRPRDIAEALELVERAKSRLLLERVQAVLEGRTVPGLNTQSRSQLDTLRAELSRAYHRLNALDENDQQRLAGSGIQEREALAPLEKAYRDALREAEQSAESGPLALGRIVTAQNLQSALSSNETLLEFYTVEDTVCAFVLTRNGLQFCPTLAPLSEVRHAARRLRYHLPRAGLPGEYAEKHAGQMLASTQTALQRLHELLLYPLLDLLKTERVIVVPHGALHGLPFHAFFDGERYALDRHEFVYAPSASFWHTGARRRMRQTGTPPGSTSGAGRILLMGVPDPSIARVATEVRQLAQVWPEACLFESEAATLEVFHTHAPTCGHIHLATHALFRDDNPLFSGVRFADGWLLARDLYEMRLDCDLATLSACHTGVTSVEPGDELFGLLRGFLAAGARSVAASLWPADDAATADLMGRFYIRMAEGVGKAKALRQAQQELRERYPHPYHWAAFALVGEP